MRFVTHSASPDFLFNINENKQRPAQKRDSENEKKKNPGAF
jgi:hypothetical protein